MVFQKVAHRMRMESGALDFRQCRDVFDADLMVFDQCGKNDNGICVAESLCGQGEIFEPFFFLMYVCIRSVRKIHIHSPVFFPAYAGCVPEVVHKGARGKSDDFTDLIAVET